MSEFSVVHLVWGPLGYDPPKAFADSYRAHPAGAEHDLVIVFNGVEDAAEREELEAPFAGIEHSAIDIGKPVLDLEAYRQVAEQLPGRGLVFLNSYARLLADDWLSKLTGPLSGEVGLTGACGSYESLRDTLPKIERVTWHRSFPGFPNPHIRTHAFALTPDVLSELVWPEVDGKKAAWGLENGRRSLYRRVRSLGRQGLVVDADGRQWGVANWETSRTFFSGEQENLLVADRRTDAYVAADGDERERMRQLAWG